MEKDTNLVSKDVLEIFEEAQHTIGSRSGKRYASEDDYLSSGERFYLKGVDTIVVPSSKKRKHKK